MKALFKTAAIAVTMAISLGVYADNGGSSAPGQPSILVTITEKGANCPAYGEVRSEWGWKSLSPQYQDYWKEGTSAFYSNPPTTVQVTAIPTQNAPGNYFEATMVKVWVIPHLHPEATGLGSANKPFNPITVNPGPCYQLPTKPPASPD
jgi:hypothetical protein